VNSCVDLQGS